MILKNFVYILPHSIKITGGLLLLFVTNTKKEPSGDGSLKKES